MTAAIPVVKLPMPRRKFIRYAVFSLIGAFTATSAVATYQLLYPTKVTGFGAKVAAGSVAEITALLAHQKYVPQCTRSLLSPARDGRGGDCGLLEMRPPRLHRARPEPRPRGEYPMPMSRIALQREDGDLIHGPATRPLDYFPITVENGTVIVDTGKVITRQAFDPGQVTNLG